MWLSRLPGRDLEECTKCITLGGCVFQDKWGTPDILGIRKSRESDIIKFPIEIVAAEIKVDTRNLITAFGQACAYRLFSHRTYLVVPRSSLADDLARLESLCIAVGLGLVLFDSHEPASFQASQSGFEPHGTSRTRFMSIAILDWSRIDCFEGHYSTPDRPRICRRPRRVGEGSGPEKSIETGTQRSLRMVSCGDQACAWAAAGVDDRRTRRSAPYPTWPGGSSLRGAPDARPNPRMFQVRK